METCVIFGSSTGTCEDLANRIASAMGVDSSNVYNVADLTEEIVNKYDRLILGSSTWGCGDLQDDWFTGIETLKSMDLSGKQVGLFSCGDASSYGDTFCNAMGTLYDELQDTGATFVGTGFSTEGYSFDDSTAVRDGAWVGLALDEINEDFKTNERIKKWVSTL